MWVVAGADFKVSDCKQNFKEVQWTDAAPKAAQLLDKATHVTRNLFKILFVCRVDLEGGKMAN